MKLWLLTPFYLALALYAFHLVPALVPLIAAVGYICLWLTLEAVVLLLRVMGWVTVRGRDRAITSYSYNPTAPTHEDIEAIRYQLTHKGKS